MIVTEEPSAAAAGGAGWQRPSALPLGPVPTEALARAAAAIAEAADDERIAQTIVGQVAAALDTAAVWLVLYDDAREWLEVRAVAGVLPLAMQRWLPTS